MNSRIVSAGSKALPTDSRRVEPLPNFELVITILSIRRLTMPNMQFVFSSNTPDPEFPVPGRSSIAVLN